MPTYPAIVLCIAGSALALGGSAARTPQAPLRVTLGVETLHAAALTAPRAAGDDADAPYILVSVAGPGTAGTGYHLPATGHLAIKQDVALGAMPVGAVELRPGESVRVLVSVLEAGEAKAEDEAAVARATAGALAKAGTAAPAPGAAALSASLAPLTQHGAQLIGAVSFVLTNTKGVAYWQRVDCAADCGVLASPLKGSTAAPLAPATPLSTVVELSGHKGTYHLKLSAGLS